MENITITKCCVVCEKHATHECPFVSEKSPLHRQDGYIPDLAFTTQCGEWKLRKCLEEINENEGESVRLGTPIPCQPLNPYPWPYTSPNPITYPQVWYGVNTWPKLEEPTTVSYTGTEKDTKDIVHS